MIRIDALNTVRNNNAQISFKKMTDIESEQLRKVQAELDSYSKEQYINSLPKEIRASLKIENSFIKNIVDKFLKIFNSKKVVIEHLNKI